MDKDLVKSLRRQLSHMGCFYTQKRYHAKLLLDNIIMYRVNSEAKADLIKLADDVESDIGAVILQQGEQDRQQVLYGVLLSQDRSQFHCHAC